MLQGEQGSVFHQIDIGKGSAPLPCVAFAIWIECSANCYFKIKVGGDAVGQLYCVLDPGHGLRAHDVVILLKLSRSRSNQCLHG